MLCRTAGRLRPRSTPRWSPATCRSRWSGLSGLLHLPEVADLVAICEVLHDPTANAALVRLLTGPRWRIGPRDLALLGRRARAAGPARRRRGDADARTRWPRRSRASTRPRSSRSPTRWRPSSTRAGRGRRTAVLRRGAGALRPAGRRDTRPAALAGRPADGRAAPGAGRHRPGGGTVRVPARAGRPPPRDAAHLPRRRGAASPPLDGEATLLAFLGFLRTAAQYEKGLDSSLPGGENTVKVLTAHKSKGLEWDVVAVPGLVGAAVPRASAARELWPAQRQGAAARAARRRGDAARRRRSGPAKGLERFAAR